MPPKFYINKTVYKEQQKSKLLGHLACPFPFGSEASMFVLMVASVLVYSIENKST